MATTNGNIAYNSADIRKEQKPNLITNIKLPSGPQRFLRRLGLPLLGVVLLLATAISWGIVFSLPTAPPAPTPEVIVQDQVGQINAEAAGTNSTGAGDDFFAAVALYDQQITAAHAAGETARAYELHLAKADFLIENHQIATALHDILLPLADQADTPTQKLRLYRRLEYIYALTHDSASRTQTIQRILQLPASVVDDPLRTAYTHHLEGRK
jgi:hypothetical protein